jgi:ATP/ADP translocase
MKKFKLVNPLAIQKRKTAKKKKAKTAKKSSNKKRSKKQNNKLLIILQSKWFRITALFVIALGIIVTTYLMQQLPSPPHFDLTRKLSR